MAIEALASGRITGPKPVRKLSEQPQFARELQECRGLLSDLASMELRFEATGCRCSRSLVFTALTRARKLGDVLPVAHTPHAVQDSRSIAPLIFSTIATASSRPLIAVATSGSIISPGYLNSLA